MNHEEVTPRCAALRWHVHHLVVITWIPSLHLMLHDNTSECGFIHCTPLTLPAWAVSCTVISYYIIVVFAGRDSWFSLLALSFHICRGAESNKSQSRGLEIIMRARTV